MILELSSASVALLARARHPERANENLEVALRTALNRDPVYCTDMNVQVKCGMVSRGGEIRIEYVQIWMRSRW